MLVQFQPKNGLTLEYKDLNGDKYSLHTDDPSEQAMLNAKAICEVMVKSGRFVLIRLVVGNFSKLQNKVIIHSLYEKDFE